MAWYNSSWLYRQKITIDATKVDEVVGFSGLPTSKLNLHFWLKAKSGAADVRITAADGTTEVARYIVSHDTTTRTGNIMFRCDGTLSTSVDTSFYVYYGNAAASDHATTDTYGRNAVFSGYAAAYILNSLNDLTGGGATLTATGSPTSGVASGIEGITGYGFNGSSQYLGRSSAVVTTWPLSIEAWFEADTTTAAYAIASLDYSGGAAPTAFLAARGTTGGDPVGGTFQGDSGSTSTFNSTTGYSANTLHYGVVTRSGTTTGTSTAYIDGGSAGNNGTTLAAASLFDRTSIGVLNRPTPAAYLAGSAFVVLYSSSARSANYVSTMDNMMTDTAFVTAAEIETEDGGMTGYRLFQTATGLSASGSLADWSNVSNALSVNADAATVVLDDGGIYESEFLELTNLDYGITIPSAQSTYDADILIRRSFNSGAAREIEDLSIRFINESGTYEGTDLAETGVNWGATTENNEYTVAGVTLSDTKFDPSTGVAIQVTAYDTNGSTTASIHTVWMNVRWTTSSGPIGGDGALTFPVLTLAGEGGVVVAGSGDADIPLLSVSGAGHVIVTGSGALDLPLLEVAGAAGATTGGTGDCDIPALTVSGSGHVIVSGTAALTLPKLRTSGNGAPVISGTGALDLPVLEVSGSDVAPVTTTGWFLFQVAESGPSVEPDTYEWQNPDYARLDNALSASVFTVFITPTTIYSAELNLRYPEGINIPSGSAITSIEYKIKRSLFSIDDNEVFDYIVRPIKGGVVAGDNIADASEWTDVDIASDTEEIEYGPSLMGLDWGAEDFGSDFGLSIRVIANKLPGWPVTPMVHTVWGKINYESVNPISGDGALELPVLSVDRPPIPTTGTSALTLPIFTFKAHSYNAPCVCCEGYNMDTLLTLRRMLVKQSGHYELVTDAENEDWSDNGADFFIRAGHRFCDDQFQYHKSEAWFYANAPAGESLVTFKNARIIKQVWINSVGGQRTLLKRLRLDDIRKEFTEPLLASESTGTPLYWVPAILGLAPQQFLETAISFDADGITDHDLIMFGNHYPYKGIYVMSPPDGDYTVQVLAEWSSYELCDDEDTNFWCLYPEISMMAARREMEIHRHRNTTGAQDFERPLLHSLQKLYHNLIAEESSGPTKVRGS